nr:pentatricopeptide repeat-containing protein At2g41720 isoform X2 [Ipomoea batatas]
MQGIIRLTKLVACFLKCKNGGVNLMLKPIMLSSMHMVELASGVGRKISWKTCYVQLFPQVGQPTTA